MLRHSEVVQVRDVAYGVVGVVQILQQIAISPAADQAQGAGMTWPTLEIDLLSHRVRRHGNEVQLSRREFSLLEYFARNPGRLLSRQQILAAVWDYDYEGESNVVDVYVRYLRTKLDLPHETSLFTTVRGSGYRFDPPQG